MSKNEKGVVKEALRATKMLFQLAWQSNRKVALSLASIRIISAAVPIVTAFIAGAVLTQLVEAITTKDLGPVISLLVMGLVIAIVGQIANALDSFFSATLRFDIEQHASEQAMKVYGQLSVAQREDKEIADLFERANTFTTNADWVFDRGLQIVTSLVSVVGVLVALFFVSPWISLILFMAMLPSLWIQIKTNRHERHLWKRNSTSRRQAMDYRNQLLNLSEVMELKLNGLNTLFTNRWRTFFAKDQKERIAYEKTTLPRTTLASTIEITSSAVVMIWAAFQIMSGILAIGYFVTLQQLVNQVRSSLNYLSWMIAASYTDLMNAMDYFQFLQITPPPRGTQKITSHGPPKIEFRNIYFRYPGAKKDTISNLSFVVQPGEDIALVGENGSGKTTIIKLLLGFYEPTKGEILINGVKLAELDETSWHSKIGVLFQEFSRYRFTTLKENIWFGKIKYKATDKDLAQSLERADIADLPDTLSKGLDTIMERGYDDENGTNLSGGQWQRVALARNFFRNADVLILDEPTAAVDAQAEYDIFQNIKRTQKDKTTVIISHRFSTVRQATHIYVLDQGKVIERGSHQELMDQNGQYAKLFNLQAEGYR